MRELRESTLVEVKGKTKPMSVYFLAKAVGHSTTQLYDIEAGDRLPSVELLYMLAEALRAEVEPLVELLENEKMASSRNRLEAIKDKLAAGKQVEAAAAVAAEAAALDPEDQAVLEMLTRYLTPAERQALREADPALQAGLRSMLVTLHRALPLAE